MTTNRTATKITKTVYRRSRDIVLFAKLTEFLLFLIMWITKNIPKTTDGAPQWKPKLNWL